MSPAAESRTPPAVSLRIIVAPLVAVLTTGALLVSGCAAAPERPSSSPPEAVTPTVAPTPTPAARWPAAGALFGGPPGAPGDHYCSAAVVDSPTGNLVITAGHCIADGDGTAPRTGVSFIPGYHDHTAPFGTWTVTAAFVDDAWRDHADPDHDLAFLTVGRAGAPPIQRLTGAYHLRLHPDPATPVDAIGYPDDADTPQGRAGTTSRRSATQLELDAHGLYDGTSGGPWLAAPADTDVIAVTGGYEQGGRNPDTSYATYLGDDAATLFHAATAVPHR